MSPVSASAVSSLRARTGVSILACKEALEEAGGDEEKAIEILRKRGIAQAAKKSARDQSEGLIFVAESGSKVGVLLLKCETDFVARDATFQSIGEALAKTLLAKGEAAMRAEAEKILPDAVQKLGENISIGEAHLIEAPVLGTYVHSNRKIAVVIGLKGGDVGKARDVAMHATAMNPLYVHPEEAPLELLAKEKEIWAEQLKKDGKPPAIVEKIMTGKERKFREENALLKQPFVKDSQKSVEEYLAGAVVVAYMRLSVS
ncbi:MAG: translation elongation factor Ts [Candidatus Peregrinibacteria bacterium]|nr:translation elongation factor Ts [Candidatus Peregrinibacteria bacterium]